MRDGHGCEANGIAVGGGEVHLRRDESGQGRELGREGLLAYLETKYVSLGLR